MIEQNLENKEKRAEAIEEYERIKKDPMLARDLEKNNIVATILTITAWVIFIAGFVAGILCGNVEIEGYYRHSTEFSFQIAFTYWATAFISGMIFIALSEIIKLLEDIKHK